jgi:hypothetical protein
MEKRATRTERMKEKENRDKAGKEHEVSKSLRNYGTKPIYQSIKHAPPLPEGISPNVLHNHRRETVNRIGLKRTDIHN